MKLSDLYIDPAAENDGVFIPYKGVRWKIARAGNPRFNDAWSEQLRPLIVEHGGAGKIPDEAAERALAVASARAILVGWDGLVDAQENPVPYSEQKALELLTDVRLAHLARFVDQQSRMDANYRVAAMQAEAGN